MSLPIPCPLTVAKEQEKERLDPGKGCSATAQTVLATLVYILNLGHSPIWDAMKKSNSISSRSITEGKPQEASY